jgi:hypothetical protein
MVIISMQTKRKINLFPRLVLLFTLVLTMVLSAMQLQAADPTQLSPMEQQTKELVERAHAFAQEHCRQMDRIQHAFENDPKFRNDEKGLYIFMHSYNAEKKEAVCIAQGIRPELIGKNMWGLRTPNGRLLFQEEIELISEQDEFWLEYDWLNPYTGKIERKRSFFKKILLDDDRTAWVGCGFWKE